MSGNCVISSFFFSKNILFIFIIFFRFDIVAVISTYTGLQTRVIKQLKNQKATITPGNSHTSSLTLSENEYRAYLDSPLTITFKVFVDVLSSDQTFFKEIRFQFELPQLNISVNPEEVPFQKEATASVSFVNPFSFKLTQLKLRIEGQDLTKTCHFELPDLAPGEKFEQSATLYGWKKGKHWLISTLDTKEVADLRHQISVNVK